MFRNGGSGKSGFNRTDKKVPLFPPCAFPCGNCLKEIHKGTGPIEIMKCDIHFRCAVCTTQLATSKCRICFCDSCDTPVGVNRAQYLCGCVYCFKCNDRLGMNEITNDAEVCIWCSGAFKSDNSYALPGVADFRKKTGLASFLPQKTLKYATLSKHKIERKMITPTFMKGKPYYNWLSFYKSRDLLGKVLYDQGFSAQDFLDMGFTAKTFLFTFWNDNTTPLALFGEVYAVMGLPPIEDLYQIYLITNDDSDAATALTIETFPGALARLHIIPRNANSLSSKGSGALLQYSSKDEWESHGVKIKS